MAQSIQHNHQGLIQKWHGHLPVRWPAIPVIVCEYLSNRQAKSKRRETISSLRKLVNSVKIALLYLKNGRLKAIDEYEEYDSRSLDWFLRLHYKDREFFTISWTGAWTYQKSMSILIIWLKTAQKEILGAAYIEPVLQSYG
jgi:hypothetical protein